MTCNCPKRWCYARADCRYKPQPKPSVIVVARPGLYDRARAQEAEAHAKVAEIAGAWLTERHEALTEELTHDYWTKSERRAKEGALAVIDAAIRRRLQ